MQIQSQPPPESMYEAVGGHAFFEALVERFYDGVETDELLRPMYPADLSDSKVNMTDFLCQYWGGPTLYNERRGHPRLRMRHAPFPIDVAARDAWMRHMNDALASAPGLDPTLAQKMNDYFAMAGDHLINTAD